MEESHPIRQDIVLKMVGNPQKVLNLGDVNDSWLTKKLKEKSEVTTIDVRPNADIKANLENRIPLDNESFDLVVAGEIIEHIYHAKNLLKEISRILKPNGHLILTTPNICSLANRIKMIFGKLPSNCASADEFDPEFGGHIRDFNLDLVRKLLNETGFKIVSEKTDGVIIRNRKILPFSPKTWGFSIIIKSVKSSVQV